MSEDHKKRSNAYLAVEMINKIGTEWPIENLDAPRYDELECHDCQASEPKANG